MTLIGAFKCGGDVVLFADRQETISDYAKWDAGKICFFESGDFRYLGAASGLSDEIEMIWEETFKACKDKVHGEIKDTIIRTVQRITKQCILPFPKRDRPWVEFIWAIQGLSPQTWGRGVELFKTSRLTVNTITSHHFAGSPLQLTKYLSDMYLQRVLIGTEEAESLAAYLLWEAGEYDPNVGKHSDIFTLKHTGEIRRADLFEIQHWQEHFHHLKESMKLLPLLSCATSIMTQKIYNDKDHLHRLMTTVTTLSKENRAMRTDHSKEQSKLTKKLVANLRKTIAKYGPKPSPKRV